MFGSGCSFGGLGQFGLLRSTIGLFRFVTVIRSRCSIESFCARFRNDFGYCSEASLKAPTKCQGQRFDSNLENQERLADEIVAAAERGFGPRLKVALAGHKHDWR